MKLAYVVHSITTEPTSVMVEVEGVKVQATINRLVMEVVAEDGDSHTVHWLPKNVDAELALYPVGQPVIVEIKPVSAPKV